MNAALLEQALLPLVKVGAYICLQTGRQLMKRHTARYLQRTPVPLPHVLHTATELNQTTPMRQSTHDTCQLLPKEIHLKNLLLIFGSVL